uniref:EGF-like domain-containing protein n=1 Tax=Anser cygnoides TaxID=8845 RepID=A0A8B9DRL5_ANSCY
ASVIILPVSGVGLSVDVQSSFLCKPNPCLNQGVCILGPGSYRCECHGWEGPHCESSKPQQTPTVTGLVRSAQPR